MELKLVSGGELPVYKIEVYDEETPVGYFLFVTQAIDILEVHTFIEPIAYGSSVDIVQQVRDFIFNTNPTLKTLVTKIPVTNLLAKKLAISAGFIQCGTLPTSYKENDIWIDQELFYMNKETLCQ